MGGVPIEFYAIFLLIFLVILIFVVTITFMRKMRRMSPKALSTKSNLTIEHFKYHKQQIGASGKEYADVVLISPSTFEKAALESPHLIPYEKGGWASVADGWARTDDGNIDRARMRYSKGGVAWSEVARSLSSSSSSSNTQLPSSTQYLFVPTALRPLFRCIHAANRACRVAAATGKTETVEATPTRPQVTPLCMSDVGEMPGSQQKVNIQIYDLLTRIPWKIAVVRDYIENGYPHTLGDIICLPESFVAQCYRLMAGSTPMQAIDGSPKKDTALDSILETLIHEKLHVLQRQYPDQTALYIEDKFGLKPSDRIPTHSLPSWVKARTRSNPDLDGWLWLTSSSSSSSSSFPFDPNSTTVRRGSIMLYTSQRPKGGLADAELWKVSVVGDEGADRYKDKDRGGQKQIKEIACKLRFDRHTRGKESSSYEHPFEAMAYIASRSIINRKNK